MRKLLVPFLVVVIVIQFILLRLSRDNVVYPRIVVENDAYIVEVVDTEMEDDSVRAVKYRLNLLADEFGQWYVDDQSSSWACWPGR